MKRHSRLGKSDKTEEKHLQKGKSGDDERSTADADENRGFGDWLRSNDGVEMMRLFVIANSLVVFITFAWPNMKQVYGIIQDYITGVED